MHVIYSFPAEIVETVEMIAPSLLDLELIEPAADLLTNLEKGNEKTHKIVESYRAVEENIGGESNVSCDQPQLTDITTDHHFLIENSLSAETVDKTDYYSTEFPVALETTTEKILFEQSTEEENISTEHPTEKPINADDSNEMQQISTSSQNMTTDAKILNQASSINEPIISFENFQSLCRFLAEYFIDSMQISSASSKNVNSNEDFDQTLSPVQPLFYEEPLVIGRSADNREEFFPDFVDFAFPESNMNSFDESILLNDAGNEISSEMYFISQQPESMSYTESYLAPPEEVELEAYVQYL